MAGVQLVALGPKGSFYIRFCDGSQRFSGLPTPLHNKLSSRNKALPPVAFLALGPLQEWFVKFADGKCYFGNTPPAFDELIRENVSLGIKYVSFGPNRTFFVRFTSGYANFLGKRHRDRFNSYRQKGIDPEKLALASNGDWWLLLGNKQTRCDTPDDSLAVSLHGARDVVFGCKGAYAIFDFAGLNSWDVNDAFDEAIKAHEEEKSVYYLPPQKIRFTQSTISSHFKDGFGSIFDLAKDLASGSVRLKDIPVIRVVKCNQSDYWSLDNRRLWAFKLSGLTSIPVQFVPKGQEFDRKRKAAFDGWTVKVQ